MSIYRQNSETGNTMGVTNKKVRRTWLHAIAVMLFCMILSIGTVVLADEVPATVTASGAKIRETADTSSKALAGVKNGDKLSICGQTTGTDGNIWYQVFVDADTKGFIRSDLVQKNADGNITTVPNQNPNTNTNTGSDAASTGNTTTTTSEVTATAQRAATVVNNGVRIRKGASTQNDVVATANRGMVLTVTGETTGTDGKVWYQVSFNYNNREITGFIRSDLVTFDNVPADTAVSEITGTEGTTETPTEPETEVSTEPETEEQPQEEPEPADENANIILENVDEEIYVLPEFTPIILKWENQDINAFKNGAFYLFHATKQNGESGWYIYDSEKGVYQRYVYDTADATIPKNSNSEVTLPVIMLFIVVVILVVVIVLMFIRLREYTSDYYDDEEYDEDDDEEDDEDEEEFEEEEAPKPVRRPQRPQQSAPAERPQPQQGNGQPPRRQPQGNGQPPRRQPQQGNGQPPKRQPGEQQPKRPTQPQNRPPKGNPNQQLQNGRKAKNFLETEDDDMEFIDI